MAVATRYNGPKVPLHGSTTQSPEQWHTKHGMLKSIQYSTMVHLVEERREMYRILPLRLAMSNYLLQYGCPKIVSDKPEGAPRNVQIPWVPYDICCSVLNTSELWTCVRAKRAMLPPFLWTKRNRPLPR